MNEPGADYVGSAVADALYDQFVKDAASSLAAQWGDASFPLPDNDTAYRQIAHWVRSLPARDRDIVRLMIERVASDTMIKVGGLFSGAYGPGQIDGKEGAFDLLYDQINIGQEFAFRLQNLIEESDVANQR